jgi:methylenetetrahydrofolate reductase (NADPH)
LITDLLAKKRCLSVELWPPRSERSAERLEESLVSLEKLRPDFASITYGAGGSTRDRTHDLVVKLEEAGHMIPMAHLTCVAHTKDELTDILVRYEKAHVMNVLALRGDKPLYADAPLPEGELHHALELVKLAKSVAPFCVAVAAHPEGHPSATDLPTDRGHLAEKLAIADFAITQFFFRVEDYFSLVEDLSSRGIKKPIVPGVMPITNVRTLEKMAELSGCAIPEPLVTRIRAVADDPIAVRSVGVEVATALCAELLEGDIPGLHFYTMNQVSATFEVCRNLGLASLESAEPGKGRRAGEEN